MLMWRRALLVWLLLMAAESLLGAARQGLLVPLLGGGAAADLRARQIGLVVSLAMIFALTRLLIRWILVGRARPAPVPGTPAPASGTPAQAANPTASARTLLAIGLAWAGLTLGFEMFIGRLMELGQTPDGGWHAVWARLAQDYDITRGGLMGLGLTLLALAPLLSARWRGGEG